MPSTRKARNSTAQKKLTGDELAKFKRNIGNVAVALAAESKLAPPAATANQKEQIAAGRQAIVEDFKCIDCHKFHDDGELGSAPDLTEYASREWLTTFISNPAHARFYSDSNDRMPAFAAHPNDPAANRLSPEEVRLLVDWLRHDWYEPRSQTTPDE